MLPLKSGLTNAKQILAFKNFSIQKNGIWYHSKKDPKKETKRILASESFQGKSHLVFIGSGLGYLVEEALIQEENSLCILDRT